MPFHMAQRKPTNTAKHQPSRMKVRLQLAGLGILALCIGAFRLSHGVLSIINYYAMPMYSGAAIGLGVSLVLFAVLPLSWIETVAHWLDSRRGKE